MNRSRIYVALLAFAGILLSPTASAEDLKAYYEKQKAEIAPTFEPPQLGSQVTIKIASGQTRTGILMKLDAASIMLMADSGTVNYKRMALHESSRAQFFAEDYAHVKALELTRAYKDQLHKENVEESLAGIHAGTLSVSGKVEKESDKEVETKENESKQSGEKRETYITTRSYSETQVLNVSVANTTTHSDSYTVEYFFFYRTVVDKNRKGSAQREPEGDVKEYKNIRLLSKGSKRITVDAKGRERFSISAEPCVVEKVTTTSSNAYSNSERAPRVSGKESAGYLVLLKYGSEILDKKASAKSYLDDDWVSKFN